MLAVRDDGGLQVVHANRAFLLVFNEKLQSLLQDLAILFIENNYTLALERLEQINNAFLAQSPVVTPGSKSAMTITDQTALRTLGEDAIASQGRSEMSQLWPLDASISPESPLEHLWPPIW